ncbi:MAG TPA: hypothetical protein VGT24_06345 [Candidatus Acidoferrales bacterium]|nr:hypothetical protein [Candidatus Acidoferrales bacterium]
MNDPRFDPWQFYKRSRPVTATRKISWDDYLWGMHCYTRKQSGERRLPTPQWALNNELLQQVLTEFMERRACVRNPNFSLRERLALAIEGVKKQRPYYQATVDRLSGEFRQCKDEARRAELQQEIESLDTFLRMIANNGGAGTIAAVVYLYHRRKLDSVGVATELGLKSPHVRMLLYRLARCWKSIQNPKPARLYVPRAPKPKALKPPRVPKSRRKFDHKLAVELRAAGWTLQKIADRFGVDNTSVWEAIKREKGRNPKVPALVRAGNVPPEPAQAQCVAA